ncbi:MAG: glutamine synthetase family protein [Ramlibacter sp.]|uniref:glutamine synthetase family protein n=1 Tax=Ramlibacter sp. TaxID=1917967 RepID=UPI00262502EA|nr:glutamine synthetase family protein [Ramlibacter sp.]MDH4374736.1 glutamine synthetase family protein [Ramlibacter sp.]
MSLSFAARAGVQNAERQAAIERVRSQIGSGAIERVRLSWCDVHGTLRSKTLMPAAALKALDAGIGMVSTLMLKDSSDRTAFKVFEPGAGKTPSGFGYANNVVLLPDPASFQMLPWSPGTGWLRCETFFADGRPIAFDTRRVLEQALAQLAALAPQGLSLTCGLEVEFHIYRIDPAAADPQLDPAAAAWPGPAPTPALRLVHPGYRLLSEQWGDMAEAPLRIVQETAQALGLPLTSLEIELGPSQVEAVFEATDALTAADQMVLFRSATTQALRRAGYHATFMCRPPFPNIMSSGWHLHQSLVRLADGGNAFMRDASAEGCGPLDARRELSDLGSHYLAGLLAHARGMSVFCTPTTNGYGRFQPNALAPQSAVWGRDNRGAMLRVIGGPGDPATRIENRIGEPAANPYLYMAAQIHAGLDGITRQLQPPPATDAPYASSADERLPTSLGEALQALRDDGALAAGFGADFVDYLCQIKGLEVDRQAQAQDPQEWQAREFFGRI